MGAVATMKPAPTPSSQPFPTSVKSTASKPSTPPAVQSRSRSSTLIFKALVSHDCGELFAHGPHSMVQGIENDSGTCVNVSLEDNVLDTHCKQLDVLGLDIEQLDHALHYVVGAICRHAESSKDEEHYVEGHRSGTFRMRALVPPAAASALIGPRGKTVKAISRKNFSIVNVSKKRFATDSGAMVQYGGKCWPVPDAEAASNQIVEVIGDLENVEPVLLDLNRHVQDHACESWYCQWAGVEGFEDLGEDLPPQEEKIDEGVVEGEQIADE